MGRRWQPSENACSGMYLRALPWRQAATEMDAPSEGRLITAAINRIDARADVSFAATTATHKIRRRPCGAARNATRAVGCFPSVLSVSVQASKG